MKTMKTMMRRAFLPFLSTAACLLAGAASAAPAAWYLWQSPYADGILCSQTSPGDGWQVLRGPFRDARCQKPGEPG